MPFKLPCGKIGAVHVLGEAFESADQVCFISFSDDEGQTWPEPISTGIMGQDSSVCAIGEKKIWQFIL